MEEKTHCDFCGSEITEQSGTWVGNDFLCECCIEEQTITCEHCGDIVWANDSVSDDNLCLCQECFDSYFNRCESCGRIVSSNDTYWECDLPYCYGCYNEMDDEEIEEYNYKPEPIFYGEVNRYYGVELEIDNGGKDNENAKILKDIANSHAEHIYIKSDGSLDDGMEIVSHPMTLNYHMNDMNWEEIFKRCLSMDYRSHQTSTCGLHIHVNRTAFGETEEKQEEVIARILYFVELHWNEIFKFSRRRDYNMNRWSARYGFAKTGKEILDKAKSGTNGRYVAVNLNNYNTIEFRLFRGTLKYNTFIAALQLVNEICNAAVSMSEEEIGNQSWSEFVSGIKEIELIRYLKERKLYVNEEVTSEEEM